MTNNVYANQADELEAGRRRSTEDVPPNWVEVYRAHAELLPVSVRAALRELSDQDADQLVKVLDGDEYIADVLIQFLCDTHPEMVAKWNTELDTIEEVNNVTEG